jgi:hypothetical protein
MNDNRPVKTYTDTDAENACRQAVRYVIELIQQQKKHRVNLPGPGSTRWSDDKDLKSTMIAMVRQHLGNVNPGIIVTDYMISLHWQLASGSIPHTPKPIQGVTY